MVLRVARHTENIQKLIDFYTLIPKMEVIGKFESHDHYDGVFLGIKDDSWHLEFTQSNHKADHKSDEDDLLVFYFASQKELEETANRFKAAGYNAIKSRNPYWNKKSFCFLDPDGFGIVLSTKA